MYYFIVNPNARRGRGEQIWKKLERQLRLTGVEYEVRMTRGQGDARKLAHELTEGCKEARALIAVGGDGTINEVLNGIAFGSQVSMGCIPTGSGNDFARSLKLSRNPGRCLKKILNPKSYRYLDYGILAYGSQEPVYRRFAVSSGIGMDAAVCQSLQEVCCKAAASPFRIGRLKYLLLGIRYFLFAKPSKGYLILDGVKKVEFNNIYFVSCHIHPFEGGGFLFAPKADSSDGLLEICVVHHVSKRKLVPMLLSAFLHQTGSRRGVHYYQCREVQVHLDRPMAVHTDGECCMCQTDIHVRCVEKKLRLLV
ncbi:MAG: diacylglycerol/lipid kinase family protein [Brotaphodocola sp.]